MYKVVLIFLLIIAPVFLHAQIDIVEVGEDSNVTTLVKKQFAGSGVKIVKVNYTGNYEAIGRFNDRQFLTGFGSGMVIANGRVELIAGKNAKPNTSTNFGDAFFSDRHIRTKASLCDGAVLEIDFIPLKDSITMSLIFGSDEYPEFVGKEFNDIFKVALLPLYKKGNAVNIARVNNKIIGINTINDTASNILYIDNTHPANPFYNHIEFDGFTKPIYIGARVTENKLYRLRIIIADQDDCDYDSGVLFEAYSFRSVSSRPRMFRPITKQYHIISKPDMVHKKCNKLLDSINRYTYDSLFINVSFSGLLTDSIRQMIFALINDSDIRAGKFIINQSDEAEKAGTNISITAYRKPE